MITAREIIEFLGAEVSDVCGPVEGKEVAHLRPSESVDAATLDWINPAKDGKQALAEQSRAQVILVDADVAYTDVLRSQGKLLIRARNPKRALAIVGNRFFVQRPAPGVHPTAVIDSGARIGSGVFIGAHCSLGACVVGDGSCIYPNVVIHDGVVVGKNVTIKAGAALGLEGFGFERDEVGNWFKFPQVGRLIVQDNVEIGANTCIDRGALSDTIIGVNTKINNLCHIAHNVIIGNNVIITGQVNVSGSSVIEDDVWIGPNATLRGHQRIERNAIIGAGAVVTKNVPANETWVGNPARKLK